MEKIKRLVETLNEDERRLLLLELLTPLLRDLDGERCVMGEGDEIVGWVMSNDHHGTLIPAHVLDRLPVDRSRCRPVSEMMKDLQARFHAEV